MIKSMNINSSVIKYAYYDTKTLLLSIVFKNDKEYLFYDVPHTVWEEFEKSNNKGKFFSSNIKGKYGRKITNLF